MSQSIQLEEIQKTLQNLKENTPPLWGQMTAQHMIEHLTDTVNLSNGTYTLPVHTPPEKVERLKAFLFSERPLSKNIKPAHLPDMPGKLRNTTFEDAIKELGEAIKKYHAHFEDDPDKKYNHPVFGELNKSEWDISHAKHFTHHFSQFGLI